MKHGKYVDEDGTERWFMYGQRHRGTGPAILKPDGTEFWLMYDKYHRVGGPAVSYPTGYRSYWQHNKLHRLDGPAVIHPSGEIEWWWRSIRVISPQDFQLLSGCTDEHLAVLLLKYGDIKK